MKSWPRFNHFLHITILESYVAGEPNGFCKTGLIDDVSECQKAAKSLDYKFDSEGVINNPYWPKGCIANAPETGTAPKVFFNKATHGGNVGHINWKPICRQGKTILTLLAKSKYMPKH